MRKKITKMVYVSMGTGFVLGAIWMALTIAYFNWIF